MNDSMKNDTWVTAVDVGGRSVDFFVLLVSSCRVALVLPWA